jgi:hypothetical protein
MNGTEELSSKKPTHLAGLSRRWRCHFVGHLLRVNSVLVPSHHREILRDLVAFFLDSP